MKQQKVCITDACLASATRRNRCEKHYKSWMRRQPKCGADGCNATLLPGERKTRSDYCRPHEQLALTKRTLAAQDKTLNRFRQSIEPDWAFGCWLWTDRPDEGYGKFHAGGPWLAHRFSYVWFFGGHSRRQTLDHICNRQLCVRPDHLEPVSDTLNVKRRDDRAFAAAGTMMVHTQVQHSTSNMDQWAASQGLPYGNPHLADLVRLAAANR